MRLSGPFASPPPRKPPKVKRDTDEERAEKNYVRARDAGCVASRASGMRATPWECDGPLDLDHVKNRSQGGKTHRTNMVVLCRHHHRAKTEYGKVWRPLLLAYLERVER